ncbi:replication initiation protein [Helicobacter salomonis]|uniref:replication initiation protein n=1 Tax=Helicobacter salomonis TaxID=56878 RepID=UPI000CF0A753|nr:replication initiation protein [Helicobacter salomonis]
MGAEQQKQTLMQQLHGLQALINAETNAVLKGVLEQEKAECLQKLLTLAPQIQPSLAEKTGTSTNTQAIITDTSPTTEITTQAPIQQQDSIETQVITQPQPTIPHAISEKYVTFHNDVNSVSLGKLGALETNLLFAIFNKLKDKQDELLVFDCDEIKAMVHAVKISKNELSGVVKRLWKNIRLANFWILLPKRDESYMLFKTFAINYHDTKKTQVKSIEIQVNMPCFGYLLNFLNANFTSFELLEFQNIRSKYAKTLYRLLKQWRSTGVPPKMEWEKFRELMGISEKVKLVRVIEYEILKPAIKELSKLPHFENLCYKKLKTKGMGNRITHIQFYFQPIAKTSKEKEQAQHDLRTIAWHIRSEKTIKQLQKQVKQKHQHDEAMKVLGLCFYKPEQPEIILAIDSVQPTLEGYEFLVKYYKDDQVFKERCAVAPNKEVLLAQIFQSGYQKLEIQTDYTLQQLSQPTLELQEHNGFKTLQGLIKPKKAQKSKQTQVSNSNNDLTEYIGRNLYMNTNGIPSNLKIKNISTLESGHIQVEIKDVDKPRKALEPFSFKSVKHFENWFKKYEE